MRLMKPLQEEQILDLGVTNEITAAANILEQLYPYPAQITCAGLTEGDSIEKAYPGVKHTPVQPHQALPFADKSFAVAYSNAVLEHVGSHSQQSDFMAELCRVAHRVFVVIPNRWFPVEHHTVLPLLHYLPPRIFRCLLRKTHYRYWSYEKNLNHLTRYQFISAWPKHRQVETYYSGIGFGWLCSNLVGYSIS